MLALVEKLQIRRLGTWSGCRLVSLCVVASATQASAQISQTVRPDGVIELSSSRSNDTKPSKAEPKRIVMPTPGSAVRATRFDSYINEAARLYRIPEALVRAVIKVESNFDPRAVSPANAHGLMQLIPATAERMMVNDIFDPRQNILGGTRYLRILANTFNGNLQLTIAAYNAGERAVARYGGIPPYEETQKYVVSVLSYYEAYRTR
jgi:soluble lytic murein transglycosylase-like protein